MLIQGEPRAAMDTEDCLSAFSCFGEGLQEAFEIYWKKTNN